MNTQLARLACAAVISLLLAACTNTPEHTQPAYAPSEPIIYPEAAAAQRSGSIYSNNRNMALFEDTRARRVGDIITIVLSEATDAAKSSDTALAKTNDTQMSGVVFAGNPQEQLDFNLGSSNDFSGESSSNQKNSLSGTISVTVARVMPNGNFYVQGEKWIQINQGNEYIRLRGIVRPVDITTNNTILSTQVADARISYSGTGPTSEVNHVGWLSRFFMSPLWPF